MGNRRWCLVGASFLSLTSVVSCSDRATPAAKASTSVHDGLGRIALRRGLRTDVLGCFSLTLGKDGTTAQALGPRLRGFHIDSAVVDTSRGEIERHLVALDSSLRPIYRDKRLVRAMWRADSVLDTLRLSFVDGFSGPEFTLSAPVSGSTDTLRGRAGYWRDLGGLENLGPALAVRIPCSLTVQE
jgi:hypothetical protein